MLRKLYNFWLSIGRVIGTINTYIILTIIFFFVITPIGIIKRIFKSDFLKYNPEGSLWVRRKEGEDLERQF